MIFFSERFIIQLIDEMSQKRLHEYWMRLKHQKFVTVLSQTGWMYQNDWWNDMKELIEGFVILGAGKAWKFIVKDYIGLSVYCIFSDIE